MFLWFKHTLCFLFGQPLRIMNERKDISEIMPPYYFVGSGKRLFCCKFCWAMDVPNIAFSMQTVVSVR